MGRTVRRRARRRCARHLLRAHLAADGPAGDTRRRGGPRRADHVKTRPVTEAAESTLPIPRRNLLAGVIEILDDLGTTVLLTLDSLEWMVRAPFRVAQLLQA